MRLASDIHGAVAALRRMAARPGPLVILGDLINFIDYRTYDGIVTEVTGRNFVAEMVRLRTGGDFEAAGALWRSFRQGREEELARRYQQLIEEAYAEICPALAGSGAYVTYGNVDHPTVLRRHLPPDCTFIEAGVVEIEGLAVGIAGGGVPSPLQVPGEVADDEMGARLSSLGHIDVLCTHVAPAIDPLQTDVIGGRQKGSTVVLEYVLHVQPAFHYFGDIHQPQAVSWRLGNTVFRNVGYFRATGRGIEHRP